MFANIITKYAYVTLITIVKQLFGLALDSMEKGKSLIKIDLPVDFLVPYRYTLYPFVGVYLSHRHILVLMCKAIKWL